MPGLKTLPEGLLRYDKLWKKQNTFRLIDGQQIILGPIFMDTSFTFIQEFGTLLEGHPQ